MRKHCNEKSSHLLFKKTWKEEHLNTTLCHCLIPKDVSWNINARYLFNYCHVLTTKSIHPPIFSLFSISVGQGEYGHRWPYPYTYGIISNIKHIPYILTAWSQEDCWVDMFQRFSSHVNCHCVKHIIIPVFLWPRYENIQVGEKLERNI